MLIFLFGIFLGVLLLGLVLLLSLLLLALLPLLVLLLDGFDLTLQIGLSFGSCSSRLIRVRLTELAVLEMAGTDVEKILPAHEPHQLPVLIPRVTFLSGVIKTLVEGL